MVLSREERFNKLIQSYLSSPQVEQMKGFIQHGNTTTYQHCHRVAWYSFKINDVMHLNANEKTLAEAGMLHDFYLYDWHDGLPIRRTHGFDHPDIACKNAARYFNVSQHVQDCIQTHMWPLTITRIPKTREAFIICMVDKYCALVETFHADNGEF